MWNPFARKLTESSAAKVASREPAPLQRERKTEIAEVEFIGATAVITVTVTELAGIEAAERLLELLEELHSSGATNYILDVQNVQLMDSACLGALVRTFKVIENEGGRIALVNADRSVTYLFKLTKLDRMFPICTDVMAALATVERTAVTRRAG